MERIHGVNLGNWLVLEKWMHPALFEGVQAEDETDLCMRLPKDELVRRLSEHRNTYITLADFQYIRALGMNSIRLPVPHFVFGDVPPYVGCIEYVDKAFEWAQQTGLSILIDLHTAPDSQNGFDNGGICGVCKWHLDPANISRVLDILEALAKRYGDHPSLLGIQLLNEPISEDLWQITKNRYLPSDPERAKGSSFVPMEVLLNFYTMGYERLRAAMPADKYVVMHDGFRLGSMCGFLKQFDAPGILLDTHIYMSMNGDVGEDSPLEESISYAMHTLSRRIDRAQRVCPVIVGEWCLAHHDPQREERTHMEQRSAYRMIADAQLMAWEKGAGFYFWSYKLPSDPPGWDLRKCVERGWITDDFR